jgi:putative redox protein
MKATVKLENGMRLKGLNEKQIPTYFDTHKEFGGDDSAATPFEVVLQSLGGCTAMDILSMLRKRKKTINSFEIHLDGERETEHPKIFKKINIVFDLVSPDTNEEEFRHIIGLSQDKYCAVAATLKRAGCEIEWDIRIFKP